ncbi:MAG: hypothetical protein ABEJ65_12550, partial [bacterium]
WGRELVSACAHWFAIGGGLCFGGVGFYLLYDGLGFISISLTTILGLFPGVFYHLLKAPTSKGQTVRTRIEALRKGLKDPSRTERTDVYDPDSFNKFLPYTYIFGLEQDWVRVFEDRASEAVRNETITVLSGWLAVNIQSLSDVGSTLSGSFSTSMSTVSGGGAGGAGAGGGAGGGGVGGF